MLESIGFVASSRGLRITAPVIPRPDQAGE